MTDNGTIDWLGIIIDLLLTWFIGMFFPVIVRFFIIKHPLSKKVASWVSGINSLILWFSNVILYEVIATPEEKKQSLGGYTVFFILFFVNRWLLMRESKVTKISLEKTPQAEVNLKPKLKNSKKILMFIGWFAGLWLFIVWFGATFNMVKTDIEENLFFSGLQMFVARVGSLLIMTLVLILSIYIFSYLIKRNWIIFINRILEWFVSIGIGIVAAYGAFAYIYKFTQGEGFYFSTIFFDISLLLVCYFVTKHLGKIPNTTRIYENLQFDWKKGIKSNASQKDIKFITDNQKKICPECKTENFEKAAYCQNCGFNFRNEEIQLLLLKNRFSILIILIVAAGILGSQHFHLFEPLPKTITGDDGSPMVLIPSGYFSMGANDGEEYSSLTPKHKVYLDSFYIDKYLVTFKQYFEFCNTTGREIPSDLKDIDLSKQDYVWLENVPIPINWYDADAYCKWAGGRLPTNAEWEKAVRGGTDTQYFWGEDSSQANYYAWDLENSEKAPHPVGEKNPNPFGLYDMEGSLFEWCNDWFDHYAIPPSEVKNPQGPVTGIMKVIRGGDFYTSGNELSSYLELPGDPEKHGKENGTNSGCRCAKTP